MVSCLSSSERGFHTHSNRKRFIRIVSSKHTKKCNFWRENIQKKKDGGGGGIFLTNFRLTKFWIKTKLSKFRGRGSTQYGNFLKIRGICYVCLSFVCTHCTTPSQRLKDEIPKSNHVRLCMSQVEESTDEGGWAIKEVMGEWGGGHCGQYWVLDTGHWAVLGSTLKVTMPLATTSNPSTKNTMSNTKPFY